METLFNLETMNLLKNIIPYSRLNFENLLFNLLDNKEKQKHFVTSILDELELTIFKDMTFDELLEAAILTAAQNIQNDTEYDKIATRLLLCTIYNASLQIEDENFSAVYKKSFKNYIYKGIGLNLLNSALSSVFDLEYLSNELMPQNDYDYNYIGLSTAEKRYMLRDRNQRLIETPQFMWMRIAMGMSINEKDPNQQAKKFYQKLSSKLYIPGGSTNIAAGTTFPVLSNCYLLDTEDDTRHIFDNVKNIALISKATGGIGISVTKLRAAGSNVKTNNTMSTGPIPFIKVMDSALKSMSRAGKKTGAMCIYMENWHLNFPDFLDLRQNAGDDYRRVRTADTAVYISDEFMKRVINDENWYMFDPDETKELTELYGMGFRRKYAEYCTKADNGEMKMYKIVPAREQMRQIITSLLSTSHPWLTWKDTINLRALNNNTGTIHCSNLCTEITLPTDKNNIAVCNLAYVNLSKHLSLSLGEDKIDWKLLEDTVRLAMRHLDNLIDVNASPLPETENSDKNNRAVGLGLSGLAETFEKLELSYDSDEAFSLTDKIFEFISYISIEESCNLAEERGSYRNFDGSMWSQGYVPYDTIENVANNRNPITQPSKTDEDENQGNQKSENTIKTIKEKIQKGLEKSENDDNKELFELLKQVTLLLESNLIENINGNSRDALNKDNLAVQETVLDLKQNRDISLDWSKLRERVKKGIRNATTMAIAPNASTGLVLGTSPGIDPRFAQIFSRSTSNGKFLDININLVAALKEIGIWENVKEKVLENYGDLSSISEIPDNLKRIYKTCFQISPYAYIEIASRAQKWIDQSLSRNMYLETRDVDEIMNVYVEAWKRGLKTTYYLHVKPRHVAEQSTVKVNKAENINKKGFGSINVQAQSTKFQAQNTKEIENIPYPTSHISNLTTNNSQLSTGVCPVDPAERALCEACQ